MGQACADLLTVAGVGGLYQACAHLSTVAGVGAVYYADSRPFWLPLLTSLDSEAIRGRPRGAAAGSVTLEEKTVTQHTHCCPPDVFSFVAGADNLRFFV